MIKNALSALPARPALFIAPALVVLVLSLYYRDLHVKCSTIRHYRVALNELLHSANTPAPFRLADFTEFAWDKVRIAARIEPGTKNVSCPFDWNWESGERDTLVEAGLLSALVFGQQGRVVQYLELRSDEVAFRGMETTLTPESAVFDVAVNFADNGGVTLTLSGQ